MKIRQSTIYYILAAVLLALAFGCGNKDDSPHKMISGDDNKIWRPVKETDAQGEERLDKDERNDIMQFFSDGKFAIETESEKLNGTWNYLQNEKQLKLIFSDNNYQESFQVLELSNGRMKLKSADGTVMEMVN